MFNFYLDEKTINLKIADLHDAPFDNVDLTYQLLLLNQKVNSCEDEYHYIRVNDTIGLSFVIDQSYVDIELSDGTSVSSTTLAEFRDLLKEIGRLSVECVYLKANNNNEK